MATKTALPTLTWTMTDVKIISGSGSPTHQQMLEGIESAFEAASNWEVYTTTSLTGSTVFLEVGPKSTSAIYNKYRILFCGGEPSGTSGNGPIRALNESTSQLAGTSGDGIWASFLLGSGSLKHPCPIGSGFDDTYGPDQRWSGWWYMHYNYASNGNKGESVYLYDSDEIVGISIENTSLNTRNLACFGAIIQPFTPDVAEPDGRVYGMYLGPNNGMNVSQFAAGGNSNTGWFTHSTSAVSATRLGGFCPFETSGSFDVWHSSDGHGLHTGQTRQNIKELPDGSLIGEPHFIYHYLYLPHYPVGQVRQMYALPSRETNRFEYTDAGSNVVGYSFNPRVTDAAGDTVLFGNS